jgi:hypothetical protein
MTEFKVLLLEDILDVGKNEDGTIVHAQFKAINGTTQRLGFNIATAEKVIQYLSQGVVDARSAGSQSASFPISVNSIAVLQQDDLHVLSIETKSGMRFDLRLDPQHWQELMKLALAGSSTRSSQ